jgi:hypothetical protein
MATEKQITANRANASNDVPARPCPHDGHSSESDGQGPKTPQGQVRASRHELRQRLLARTVLPRAESHDSFTDFAAGFYAEYQPGGATETAPVDALITARWRAMRTNKMEAVQIDREFDLQHDPSIEDLDNATRTGAAYREAVSNSGALHLIDRVQINIQRRFDSAFDRLMVPQTRREKRFQDRGAIAPPPACKQTNPIEL